MKLSDTYDPRPTKPKTRVLNWELWRRNVAWLALAVLFIFFMIMNPQFVSVQNLGNILKQGAPLFIIATGATFVILMGEMDLSVDGVVTLCGITSVLIVSRFCGPYSGWIAVLGATLLGLVIGTAIGLVFTRFRLPSFLVSFGFSTICLGLGLIITSGGTILGRCDYFKVMGSGTTFGMPNLGLIAIFVLAMGVFVSYRTRFGRYCYAIGGGGRVAQLCGIPIARYRTAAFMFACALTGLAGALMSSRLGAASNTQGASMALNAIAAVVMGGTTLSGGKGSVGRTIAGVLVIILLSNGLNLMGVPHYTQIVIKGVVVIVAVAFFR